MSHISRDPTVSDPSSNRSEAHFRCRMRAPAHRHRGTARTAGRRRRPPDRHDVHDQLSHAVPGIRPGALVGAGRLAVCVVPPISQSRRGMHGGDGQPEAGSGGTRVPEPDDLVPGRLCRPVPTGCGVGAAEGTAAPDLHQCGSCRGREEHPGLPRPRPSRIQGGGRGRPGSGAAAAGLSGGVFHGRQIRRRSRRTLRQCRRLRLSVTNRDIRSGSPGGAGMRCAGGRLSRHGPRRCHQRQPYRRPCRGSRAGGPGCPRYPGGTLPGLGPSAQLGGVHASVSRQRRPCHDRPERESGRCPSGCSRRE